MAEVRGISSGSGTSPSGHAEPGATGCSKSRATRRTESSSADNSKSCATDHSEPSAANCS